MQSGGAGRGNQHNAANVGRLEARLKSGHQVNRETTLNWLAQCSPYLIGMLFFLALTGHLTHEDRTKRKAFPYENEIKKKHTLKQTSMRDKQHVILRARVSPKSPRQLCSA